jgi:hypothetical protein
MANVMILVLPSDSSGYLPYGGEFTYGNDPSRQEADDTQNLQDNLSRMRTCPKEKRHLLGHHHSIHSGSDDHRDQI